jgi:hypothetical protein
MSIGRGKACYHKIHHPCAKPLTRCKTSVTLEVFTTITLTITFVILVKDETQHKGGFPSNIKQSYRKIRSSLQPPILVTQTYHH